MRKIVLDTEFAGKYSKRQIVEISAHEIIDGKIGKNFHVYVNPLGKLDPFTTAVHGLTNDFLKGKPTFEKVWSQFRGFINNSPIYIHQADSDISVLEKECILTGRKMFTNKVHCTQKMSQKIFGRGLSLLNLCHNLGVEILEAHRGINDSFMLAQCILKMETIDYTIIPEIKYESKKITNITKPMEILDKEDGKYVKFYHKQKDYTVKIPEYPETHVLKQSENGYLFIKDETGELNNSLGPCVVGRDGAWLTRREYMELIKKLREQNKPKKETKNQPKKNTFIAEIKKETKKPYKIFEIEGKNIIYKFSSTGDKANEKQYMYPIPHHPANYKVNAWDDCVVIQKPNSDEVENPLGYCAVFVSDGNFMGLRKNNKIDTLCSLNGREIIRPEISPIIPKKSEKNSDSEEDNSTEKSYDFFFEENKMHHSTILDNGEMMETEIKNNKIYFHYKNKTFCVDIPYYPEGYEITVTKTSSVAIYQGGKEFKKPENPLGPCVVKMRRGVIVGFDGNKKNNKYTPLKHTNKSEKNIIFK